MNHTSQCVGCGAEIPAAKSSNGLCPTCLLKLGVGRSDSHAPRDNDPTTSDPRRRRRGDGERMIPEGQQFGPYRIQRLLGKGGMGEVYEAVDESGRRLALKVLARAEHDLTDLTMTGAFMGTPAFASPEQLRADDLNVRSDIYAVGATLYYLLMGHAPFEETNVLKLATMIAQEPPRSLDEFKPDVPKGLAAVVTRCLAKQPDNRFATYAALAEKLEPFSSTAPRPATVGLRVAAGASDWFVVGGLLTPAFVGLQWGALDSGSTLMALRIASIVLTAAYFFVSESRWGPSVGKALCGLRVVAADQVKPNLGPALLRGLLFAVPIRIVEVFVAQGEVSTHPGIVTHVSVGMDVSIAMGFPDFPLPWGPGTPTVLAYGNRVPLHHSAKAERLRRNP